MTADGTRLGSTATKASVGFRTLGSVLLAHLCRHVTALTPRVCELHDPPVAPLLHELEGIDAAVRPLGALVKDVRHPGARERPVHPNLDVPDALVPHLPRGAALPPRRTHRGASWSRYSCPSGSGQCEAAHPRGRRPGRPSCRPFACRRREHRWWRGRRLRGSTPWCRRAGPGPWTPEDSSRGVAVGDDSSWASGEWRGYSARRIESSARRWTFGSSATDEGASAQSM